MIWLLTAAAPTNSWQPIRIASDGATAMPTSRAAHVQVSVRISVRRSTRSPSGTSRRMPTPYPTCAAVATDAAAAGVDRNVSAMFRSSGWLA